MSPPRRSKFSRGHSPPRRREMLNFHMKTTLKLKIIMMRAYLELYIYPSESSAALPNLVRLSL
jgi:hypothetical protein